MQCSLFILTMKDNCHIAMVEPCSHNLLTILWKQLITFQIVVHQMSKYIKLAKFAVIQVLGSIEDEWCFNTLSFMKSKLQIGQQLILTQSSICLFKGFTHLKFFLTIKPLKNGRLFVVVMHLMLKCYCFLSYVSLVCRSKIKNCPSLSLFFFL